MIIDFKEIPQANITNGNQDKFELFARDFLEMLGYEIIESPNRGADGKKDLIISENLKGIDGKTKEKIKWLVSCKHYAHSGNSVRDIDEPDISDRVKNHKCQGFIAFYSTLPQSALSNKLNNFQSDFKIEVFDGEKIEGRIIGNMKMENIFLRYFPNSYENYKKIREKENVNSKTLKIDNFSELMNAVVLFDFEKFKFRFYNNDWDKREEIFPELYIYKRFVSDIILIEIFDFLEDISNMTRAINQKNIASSIFSAILEFFPINEINNNIELIEKTIKIGFNITYDALIHLKNLEIAMYGLTIIKFIYRNANRLKNEAIKNKVFVIYDDLNNTLKRPERNDLEDAKELVQIFKNDLERWSLSFPMLSKNLTSKIYK